MILRKIKMDKALTEDLDKLTDFIVDVIKANKYEVINRYHAGSKGVHIDCKNFSLEVYTYPFLKESTIWIFCKISKKDKYDSLIRQLELLGFEVYVSDIKISEELGVPLIREVNGRFDEKRLLDYINKKSDSFSKI